MKSHPFSLTLRVPSRRPEGMWIVTKDVWSGIGFRVPRVNLEEFAQQDEASHPGVYVLFGPSQEGGQDSIYIGESDNLARRLSQHLTKESWSRAYIFTTQGDPLNKAHVQYLETQLLHIARSVKRCRLENKDAGNTISLSEADKTKPDAFLREMLLCCPVLV